MSEDKWPLTSANLDIATAAAKRIWRRIGTKDRAMYEDLRSEAYVRLMNAEAEYNEGRGGMDFRSFAHVRVHQRLMDWSRSSAGRNFGVAGRNSRFSLTRVGCDSLHGVEDGSDPFHSVDVRDHVDSIRDRLSMDQGVKLTEYLASGLTPKGYSRATGIKAGTISRFVNEVIKIAKRAKKTSLHTYAEAKAVARSIRGGMSRREIVEASGYSGKFVDRVRKAMAAGKL